MFKEAGVQQHLGVGVGGGGGHIYPGWQKGGTRPPIDGLLEVRNIFHFCVFIPKARRSLRTKKITPIILHSKTISAD